jgi:hypothetical protein
MQVYETHGVRFEYPDGWELSVDESEDQIAATVEGPGTAFWTMSLIFERPPADEIIDSALQCFEEEYGEIDVYESDERICLLPTVGLNLDLISLDIVSKVSLRAGRVQDLLDVPDLRGRIRGARACPASHERQPDLGLRRRRRLRR